jgi:hypothetical protein
MKPAGDIFWLRDDSCTLRPRTFEQWREIRRASAAIPRFHLPSDTKISTN